MKDTDKITAILKELVMLLKSVDEKNWQHAFENLSCKCESIESEHEMREVKREIRRIYGGMGSFSDLVLFKQNTALIPENQKLEKLRKNLFELVS